MPTADVKGPQRKVLDFMIKPVKPSQGETGIPVRGGRTLPFSVRRQWVAPAGHYAERFYLVEKDSREIVYEGPERRQATWGLQGATEKTTTITDPIPLAPGTYLVVFALGGISGGEFDVDAVEVPS